MASLWQIGGPKETVCDRKAPGRADGGGDAGVKPHPCLLEGAAAEVQAEAVSQAAGARRAHSCANNITRAPQLPQSEQVHKTLDSRLQASQD